MYESMAFLFRVKLRPQSAETLFAVDDQTEDWDAASACALRDAFHSWLNRSYWVIMVPSVLWGGMYNRKQARLV